MTIIATNISENARETMKKFCTVRNGRKVKTERITRMFPQMHRTTILERTSATGRALANGIGRIAEDADEKRNGKEVEFIGVKKLKIGGDSSAIFESLEEIKYQSELLIVNGKRMSLSALSLLGRRKFSSSVR